MWKDLVVPGLVHKISSSVTTKPFRMSFRIWYYQVVSILVDISFAYISQWTLIEGQHTGTWTQARGRSQPWLSGGGKVGELPGGALAPIACLRAQGGVWGGMCNPQKLEDFGILILNSRNLVITFMQKFIPLEMFKYLWNIMLIPFLPPFPLPLFPLSSLLFSFPFLFLFFFPFPFPFPFLFLSLLPSLSSFLFLSLFFLSFPPFSPSRFLLSFPIFGVRGGSLPPLPPIGYAPDSGNSCADFDKRPTFPWRNIIMA